jgi:hypothetical protein
MVPSHRGVGKADPAFGRASSDPALTEMKTGNEQTKGPALSFR